MVSLVGRGFVCFFKQKTAYEMRISDWSSDVCSSDLGRFRDEQRILPHVHRDPDAREEAGQKPDGGIGNPGPNLKGAAIGIDLGRQSVDPALKGQIGRASCRERVGPYA